MTLALDLPFTRPVARTETPVLIDLDTCRLLRPDGREGPRLQGKPLAFLSALVTRPGAVVRYQAMVDHLWAHDHDVDTAGGVHFHARRLRDALEAIGWPRSVVGNVEGAGWYVDMDVVEQVRREARGE